MAKDTGPRVNPAASRHKATRRIASVVPLRIGFSHSTQTHALSLFSCPFNLTPLLDGLFLHIRQAVDR